MTVLCLDCGERFFVEDTDELNVCPYCWSDELQEVA